ncbi:dUTP diphosphatase [Clostridium tyrobutyricum]|jgi:dUTP pyrophosphatase|uniref:Deoxyuridine 5'-triphosphate nucleotidohydrolase n=1 Tax=Clostridium tyrobutyricum DIVETGP TaxID=1408889 RepID=W6N6R9_CLOTY|nr:dUTP diphosphatase [Clostridium tyrobutyricum]AND85294.1 deoxyuridine 5'-triphosphate nucleotidohydrolase [Clostridium tyrobutyricum]ANP69850.1 deoxyuridine 5'-triphosphate nucleotidohydrolase [Clostridium tyrobutyricum]MBR9646842.1 dUTP diphosphatase [Clostridium tyrobutyricum]MBV4415296.1 dUTP diphosphatase [Clostridium tyrobutyricum]MBV4419153.1 dUTP diphosphatase [Clostridium tyrobutyricum]
MKLLVKKVNEKAVIPFYAHVGDAGLDLFSVEKSILKPMERKLIATGIKIELPKNTEAQIRPRSGLALKYGITLLNSPGTIDEGYRGEIKVLVINLGQEPFLVEENMKIAQMVIKPVEQVLVKEVYELSDTERGEGGFGSTGV